jgi:hypothetical protein
MRQSSRAGPGTSHWKASLCRFKMWRKQSRLSSLLAIALLIMLVGAAGVAAVRSRAGARNPCSEPGNLAANCGFDVFVDRWNGEKRLQVPDAWWYFVLEGDPDFRPAEDTYWGAPSLCILSDGMNFSAGIYQQVKVTPGVVYQTDIGWAAARCNFQTCGNMERRLGLDPNGGTDPRAPSVVWSRTESGGDKWPDLTVSARATGPVMTVFVWVHHPSSSGLDEIYLDAVGLWPDPNQPAATVTPRPSPTPTRRPPTRTPKPAPPTPPATALPPSPTDTETPAPAPTEAPTDTPPPRPTATWTATPSPTNTPTASPPPTLTPLPVARVVQTPMVQAAAGVVERSNRLSTPEPGFLLYMAGAAFLGALLLGATVLGLWLRGRRAGDEGE